MGTLLNVYYSRFDNHGSPMLYLIASLWLLFASSVQAEQRQLYDENSPVWLTAVGTLSVPGHRFESGERLHHHENCSATLVGPRTILTAWHCLEFYRDLSQTIVFTLPYMPQQPHWRATRLANGGGMSADWALLRLERAVSGVVPLPVHGYFNTDSTVAISMAGYSRDAGLGNGGANLTWQATCQVTANEQFRVATNCQAYKGASGGPVISNGKIIGVISAGDGEELTYYAPSSRFTSALRLYLR